MDRDIWHYDLLEKWNEHYYKNIFLQSHLTGEEIALGQGDEKEFFYIAKREQKWYLIPSEIVQKGELPFRLDYSVKIGVKGKAFHLIKEITSLTIKAEQTMSYKEMIDSWMDYEHDNKKAYTLWKIITETFYSSRINVRVVTYPGWLKDSVPFTVSRLLGNSFTVNKPSLAKLKFLLRDSIKGLCLNEIQKLEPKERQDLAKFYEDVGDFKTIYTNPTRSSFGVQEQCNIKNLSTFTFSNFPDSKKQYEEQKEDMFDSIFEPKVRSRIFPLLFTGGDEITPACKQRFAHISEAITKEEIEQITNWMRNFKYYENEGQELASKKLFKNNYYMSNTRWDRNFQAISERIKLYCETQEEFDSFTKLLWKSNRQYTEWVQTNIVPEHKPVIEEKVEDKPTLQLKPMKSAPERVMEVIEKHKEINIESLMEEANVTEQVIDRMKQIGDIFEPKKGIIRRL